MIKQQQTTVTDYGRSQMQSTTVNSSWKNLRTKKDSFFEKSKKMEKYYDEVNHTWKSKSFSFFTTMCYSFNETKS